MVDLNYKIQILFFILSMILSVHGFQISILNVSKGFKYKTNIQFDKPRMDIKKYTGTYLRPNEYLVSTKTQTIIVHAVASQRFEAIANFNALEQRRQLANELEQKKIELIVLGADVHQDCDLKLLHDVIMDIVPEKYIKAIRLLAEPMNIGEDVPNWKRMYLGLKPKHFGDIIKGKNVKLSNGTLDKYLTENFPKIERKWRHSEKSKMQNVKFYKSNRFGVEKTAFDVQIVKGKYRSTEYAEDIGNTLEFLRGHPNVSCHILIVSGTEYNRIMSDEGLMEKFQEISDKIYKKYDILYLMGCFNFDWTEIDVAHQIILNHVGKVEDCPKEKSKWFTIGVGMFSTFAENPDACLPHTTDKNLIKFASERNAAARSGERALQIYDFNVPSGPDDKKSILFKDHYVPQKPFSDKYCFATNNPDEKYVFIVMDSAEMDGKNFSDMTKYAQDLKKGKIKIIIYLIRTTNFELYDLHIISEWVERHRGDTNPNQITILGSGKFDTEYQYFSSFYEVTYTNDLAQFRNLYIDTAKQRDVFVFQLDPANSTIETRKYPVHTINGFYDPVATTKYLIFGAEYVKKNILFLILEAGIFNQKTVLAKQLEANVIRDFRGQITSEYPIDKWDLYLIGLRNFEEEDSHLFAEFVTLHTFPQDKNPLWESAHTYRDHNNQTDYVYLDFPAFHTVADRRTVRKIKNFFGTFNTVSELIEGM